MKRESSLIVAVEAVGQQILGIVRNSVLDATTNFKYDRLEILEAPLIPPEYETDELQPLMIEGIRAANGSLLSRDATIGIGFSRGWVSMKHSSSSRVLIDTMLVAATSLEGVLGIRVPKSPFSTEKERVCMNKMVKAAFGELSLAILPESHPLVPLGVKVAADLADLGYGIRDRRYTLFH